MARGRLSWDRHSSPRTRTATRRSTCRSPWHSRRVRSSPRPRPTWARATRPSSQQAISESPAFQFLSGIYTASESSGSAVITIQPQPELGDILGQLRNERRHSHSRHRLRVGRGYAGLQSGRHDQDVHDHDPRSSCGRRRQDGQPGPVQPGRRRDRLSTDRRAPDQRRRFRRFGDLHRHQHARFRAGLAAAGDPQRQRGPGPELDRLRHSGFDGPTAGRPRGRVRSRQPDLDDHCRQSTAGDQRFGGDRRVHSGRVGGSLQVSRRHQFGRAAGGPLGCGDEWVLHAGHVHHPFGSPSSARPDRSPSTPSA